MGIIKKTLFLGARNARDVGRFFQMVPEDVRLQAGGRRKNTKTLGGCVDEFGHTCHIVGGRGGRRVYEEDKKETRSGGVEMDLYCT